MLYVAIMDAELEPTTDIHARITHFNNVMEAIRIGNAESLGLPVKRTGIFARPLPELPGFDDYEVAAVALHLVNTDLEPVGLKIEPVWEMGVVIGPGGLRSFGHAGPLLKDGGRFSGFLHDVGPDKAGNTFRENASLAVNGLIEEVSEAVSRNMYDDSAMQTLEYACAIAAELRYIGVADNDVAARLLAYAEHAARGDLAEYVGAERLHLLDKHGDTYAGPAVWHRTELPDNLARHWNEVFGLLYKTLMNPRARQLYGELIGKTAASLEFAQRDRLYQTVGETVLSAYGAEVDDVFAGVRTKLHQIRSYDAFLKKNRSN